MSELKESIKLLKDQIKELQDQIKAKKLFIIELKESSDREEKILLNSYNDFNENEENKLIEPKESLNFSTLPPVPKRKYRKQKPNILEIN
jgi:DNA integrity scanning protein DisA with diadenylate cyclase activity